MTEPESLAMQVLSYFVAGWHGTMAYHFPRGYDARWFNAHRPHQGLGGRTPDEVHFGKSTRAKLVPLRAVVEVKFLDGDRDSRSCDSAESRSRVLFIAEE